MTCFQRLLILFQVFVIVLHFHHCDFHGLLNGRSLHQFKAVGNNTIIKLAKMSDMSRFKNILKKIMIPRIVGTETHTIVKKYLIKEMSDLGWSVETHPFQEKTPKFGTLQFENIVARLNPNADRYLVLACHYDSKYMREGEFLGATDSAVPCTMMVDLAHALKDNLTPYKNTDLSLMFIFFDGEEAFVRWGPDDSIYGARNLAKKWQLSKYPRSDSETNNLDRMELLVLLDLLGAAKPVFFNYFSKSERWYRRMISAEDRLNDKRLLINYASWNRYFTEMSMGPHIEDDHLPFLEAGVPVLHVIPVPFPNEWHTPEDNWDILDFTTIDNLNKIMRVFVIEYLKGYKSST